MRSLVRPGILAQFANRCPSVERSVAYPDPFVQASAVVTDWTFACANDLDLPFLFQWNPGHYAVHNPPFTAAERKIAIQMGRYWGNFARTGNPNGPELPQWNQYVPGPSAPTLLLTPGGAQAMPSGAYYQQHKCGFWESLSNLQAAF